MKASWMLVAGFFFACMGLCVKIGDRYFSSQELVFYRSLVGLMVIGGFVYSRRLTLATPHWRMHASRSLAGLGSLSLYFYAIAKLPIATAVTLNYTSPMFLALITTLWYREEARTRFVFSILLGFVGVVLLLKPTMTESQLPAGLLGLISGFFAAIAYLNVKQMGAMGEPDWRVVFYFAGVSTLISGLLLCFDTFHAINWENLWILAALGTTATLGQLCMTRAYRTGSTLVVGSLAYATVVFAAVMGLFVLDELLPLASWLGIAIIVAAGLFATRESVATSD